MALKWINLLLFVLMVFLNYLANALPLNGKTTGELSAEYPNLFVPAGVTFSIWGVIYLLLLVFVIVQFRESNRDILEAVGWAFAISCLFNAAWIVAWHYQHIPASLLVMLGLLISLVYIGEKIQDLPAGFFKLVFGLYLGWICVATIANVTAALVYYNWGGWGISESVWAMVMIGAGFAIIAISSIKLQNPFAGLAVAWAYAGIALNRHNDHLSIAVVAIAGTTVILTLSIFLFFKYTSFRL